MNRKTSTLISLGISAALIAAGIWFLYNFHGNFGYGYGRGRWMIPHHGLMGGAGGGMGIIMILFWVAVIAAIVLAVSGAVSSRHSSSGGSANPSMPDALEILKQRYARGEIDKDRFEAMKRELE